MMKVTVAFFLLTFCLTQLHAQAPHAPQLYGMLQYGGPEHNGSIFHFTPSTQQATVDYDFMITVKGAKPKGDIVSGNNGKYYGTSSSGGTNNGGVLFEWDSITGIYKELYQFNTIDGNDPRGGMVLYNGKLYGMTDSGGVHHFGVIYEWDLSANTYTKKTDMDSVNGKNPTGSLTLVGNTFYGFTSKGGTQDKGVLFEWNPATNVYTKHYDFDQISGSNPVGKLVPSGSNQLYAMTHQGGIFDMGTIYEWNYATHVFTKKHDFNGTDGSLPMGQLTLYNNRFYGITYEGGVFQTPSPYSHFGVIFEWDPATNVFVKRLDMGSVDNTITHGSLSSLTLKGNLFYGITSQGPGNGAIFKWDPVTNLYNDMYHNYQVPLNNRSGCDEYRHAPGIDSYSTLFLSGTKLLGTCSGAGGQFAGCIFEYFPDSNQVTRAVHMLASEGKYPRGSLSKLNNKLYGLSQYGGANHEGTVFEWDMATQQFKERLAFDGYHTGISPKSSLTLVNGKFYGINVYGKSSFISTSSYHGIRDYSEIFSWDPVSDQYQRLYNFSGETASPASLTACNHRLLYPHTKTVLDPLTNTYSYMGILELNTSTNTVTDTILIKGGGAFVNYQDQESANGLTYYNGRYYGLSPGKWNPATGFEFKGTIYEWDTTLTNGIHRLDLVDSIAGTYPTGNLILVDSVFYGLTTGTSSGGIYNNGGLFRWNPRTNVSERLWNVGGFGTPTYSGGKIYYLIGSIQSFILEYDPVLDTAFYYPLPTYLGSGTVPYQWFNGLCSELSYQQLLEVIPNKDPVLSNIPATQTICSNRLDSVSFKITDLDPDTMSFQITSSNPALMPLSQVTITNHHDSIYTIHYSGLPNQSGQVSLSVTANDGYGGSVNFSFVIQVNQAPTVTINSGGICTGQSFTLNPSGAMTYSFSSGTAVVTPTATTVYTVTGTDANGCKNTAVSTVSVGTPPTITVNSGSVCSGQSFTIIPNGATSYTFSGGSPVVMPSVNSTYSVSGSLNGCVSLNPAISHVTVAPLPVLNISTSHTLICVGQTATLTASGGVTTFTWSTAENTAGISVSPTVTMVYNVSGTGANGCSNTAMITQSVSACIGISDLTQGNLQPGIYPNPVTGVLNISFDTFPQNTKLELYNMQGGLILTEQIKDKLTAIHTQQLGNGMYLVKISENNRILFVKKIVKQD